MIRNILFLSLLVVALSSQAVGMPHGEGGMGPGHGKGERILAFLDSLDLTADQKRQIATVLQSEREQLRTVADQSMKARQELFATFRSETFDESAIREASKKVGAAEEELAVLRGKMMHDVRAVLTAEQRTKLAELRSDKMGHFAQAKRRGEEFLDSWIDKQLAPQDAE